MALIPAAVNAWRYAKTLVSPEKQEDETQGCQDPKTLTLIV